jgi:hypothetical protein
VPQDGVFICVVLKESGVEAESIMFNDRLGRKIGVFRLVRLCLALLEP